MKRTQSAMTSPVTTQPVLLAPTVSVTQTEICYILPKAARVSLRVLDLTGRVVRVLEKPEAGEQPSGRHTVSWNACGANGRQLPAGIYYCVLRTEDWQALRKVALIR